MSEPDISALRQDIKMVLDLVTNNISALRQDIKMVLDLVPNLANYSQIADRKEQIYDLVWKRKVWKEVKVYIPYFKSEISEDVEATQASLFKITREVNKITSLLLLNEIVIYLLSKEGVKTGLEEIHDKICQLKLQPFSGEAPSQTSLSAPIIRKKLFVHFNDDTKFVLPMFRDFDVVPLKSDSDSPVSVLLFIEYASVTVSSVAHRLKTVPKITPKVIIVVVHSKNVSVDFNTYISCFKEKANCSVVSLPYSFSSSNKSVEGADEGALAKIKTYLEQYSTNTNVVEATGASIRYKEVLLPHEKAYKKVAVKGDWDWDKEIDCTLKTKGSSRHWVAEVPVKGPSAKFCFCVLISHGNIQWVTSTLYATEIDSQNYINNIIIWDDQIANTSPTRSVYAYVETDIQEAGESLFSSYTLKKLTPDSTTETSFVVIFEYTRQSPERLAEQLGKIPKITKKVIVIVLATINAITNERSVQEAFKLKGATEVQVKIGSYIPGSKVITDKSSLLIFIDTIVHE